MSNYRLEIIKDRSIMEGLLEDPYIQRVGHDDRPAKYIDDDLVSYLGAYLDDEFLGAFCIIESGFYELDLHAMLKKSSLKHSRMLGFLCLAYAFSFIKIHRVSANIIEGLESAKNYCLKLGFKEEGFKRDACMVNGSLKGVHMLGMVRSDFYAIMHKIEAEIRGNL